MWQSPDGTRYYKLTKDGTAGQIPRFDPNTRRQWSLQPALPDEYRERIGTQNRIFQDDLKLEGVKRDAEGFHIATSQPFRKAMDPENPYPKDGSGLIEKYLGNHGFVSVGDKAWYHPEYKVMIADAKPENFIQTGPLSIEPIDLIIRPLGNKTDVESSMLHQVVRDRAADKARADEAFKNQAAWPPPGTTRILPPPPSPTQPPGTEKGLQAVPLRRSNRKGRPELYHLPDDVPATEKQRYGMLNSAVNLYQSRFPALYRRFRKGTTEGRSGFECKFREASGRITPASLKAALITVQEDKVVADTAGLSPRQTVFHIEHALGEEVRHLASLYAALALWEHPAKQQRQWQALEPWLVGYFSKMWHEDFGSLQRIAVLHAYAGNYGNPQRGNKMTYVPQDWQLALEGLRMFSQARAGTLPTEADQLWHWPKHSTYPLPQLLAEIQHAALGGKSSPGIEWMLRAMDELMRLWHARERQPTMRAGLKAA